MSEVEKKIEALDLFEIFGSSKESEEDGVWVDLNSVTKFKIRAYNSKAVVDLSNKLTKPFQMMIRAKMPIPDEKNEEIGLRLISEAILADWQGVVIDGGTVPYSKEAAYALMKRLPNLALFISQNAQERQNFKDETREEDAGN